MDQAGLVGCGSAHGVGRAQAPSAIRYCITTTFALLLSCQDFKLKFSYFNQIHSFRVWSLVRQDLKVCRRIRSALQQVKESYQTNLGFKVGMQSE